MEKEDKDFYIMNIEHNTKIAEFLDEIETELITSVTDEREKEIIYSLLIIVLSIFTFIQIMIFINIYIPNNKLGAYETLLSFGFGFPYDGIIVLIILFSTNNIKGK